MADEILPYDCIMVGDWDYNAPWRVDMRMRSARHEQMKK